MSCLISSALWKVVTYCSTVLATTLPAKQLRLLTTVQTLSLQELCETKKRSFVGVGFTLGVLTGQVPWSYFDGFDGFQKLGARWRGYDSCINLITILTN